ncbi:MAG: hypothetical protein IKV72_07855 [Firmicutes bacterium]|nr:hypothetical protein [Bacillota bacterium]MBR6501556.1 hypothetical protein [Bacillota bacterium]
MRTIRYYYSSMAKQFFLMILAVSMLVRMALMFVVTSKDIGGYGDAYNVGASMVLYIAFIAGCAFFFIAYRFFHTEFTEHEVTNVNRILKRRKTISLDEITYANFDRGGILLYREKGSRKPDFVIKFYKFGVASPVGIESFEKLCQYKGIAYDKNYNWLPGQSRFSKLCSIGYIALIICLGINALQYLMVVLAVLMNG